MPTILCIDDDANILELQKRILEAKGYAVLVSPDGATGITLASSHPVDLVVLDFKMPDMDGGEVAAALLREQPDLPIVICSGFFDSVPEWLRWFAAAYVPKGDGPGVLLSRIQELLAKKKLTATTPSIPEAPAA
jgi:DNA-binding response OmpR family regulator